MSPSPDESRRGFPGVRTAKTMAKINFASPKNTGYSRNGMLVLLLSLSGLLLAFFLVLVCTGGGNFVGSAGQSE